MTDIIQAFRDGKRIRRKNWTPERYIYFNPTNNTIINAKNDQVYLSIQEGFFFNRDYELYQEPQKSEFEKWASDYAEDRIEYLEIGFKKAIEVLEDDKSKVLLSMPPQNQHYIAIKYLKNFLGEK